MTPRQITKAKHIVIASWVLLATGCGAANDQISFPGSSSTTAAPAADPVSVSNTAGAAKELGVGDVYQVVFDGQQSFKIDMTGVSSDSEYVLAVANLNITGASSSVQVAGSESQLNDVSKSIPSNAASDEDSAEFSDAGARFHEELRFQESVMVSRGAPFKTGKAMVASAAASATVPREGDQTRFQVLTSLSGGSKSTVSATAMYVGQNVICYLDQEVTQRNPSDLTREDVRTLCANFDARVSEEHAIFGTESDVDGNGHVNVLMTPQVNKMGAALGGLITGFFYAADLYDPGMEIIHTLVPDSAGVYGQTVPKTFTMENLLPSVLVHELQHAINYNQHVLLRGGQPEDPIINEGLSHLAEDLMGEGRENYARYETFLSRPSSFGLFGGGSPSLGARGASYLFLRYLLEQSGRNDFVNRISGTALNGVENVESAFGGAEDAFNQFGEFYLRWVTTLIMDGAGVSKDARYSYEPRTRSAATGNWEGVCLRCDAEDGRGTILDGVTQASYSGSAASTLQPGGVQFYRVSQASSEILLYGRDAGNFGAALVRIK